MPCSAWLKTISRPPAGIVTYHKSKVAPCNTPLDVAKCWATAQTITAAITPITTSSSMCQVCVNGRVKEPLTSHLPSQLNLPLKVVFFYLAIMFAFPIARGQGRVECQICTHPYGFTSVCRAFVVYAYECDTYMWKPLMEFY